MNRSEMSIRLGYYCGFAAGKLRDDSYARRYLGRMHEVDEQEYLETCQEIQQRLVAAGHIGPDEDPWDKELSTQVANRVANMEG